MSYALEIIGTAASGIVVLGAGIGAGLAYAKAKLAPPSKPKRSDAPQAQPADVNTKPGDTGRFDLPPCGEHTVRLAALEARMRESDLGAKERSQMLVEHGEQLARIETKLDYALPQHAGGGRRA